MLTFAHAAPEFRTFCGPVALGALPKEVARAGASRVVVFYGASMACHVDALNKVEQALGDRLVGRFDEVREHSPVPTVTAAASLLGDLAADGIVAVGGGSAIVTARAAAIVLAEQRHPRELCTTRSPDGRLSSPRLSKPKIPMWIVPSTPTTAYAKAGSAVRDPDTGDRLALFDPKTRARGVFFDETVAATAPAGLVQSSALNAFAMAVEGLQTDVDPLTEALLSHALRQFATNLPQLRDQPDDPDLRLRLMTAALLSGQGSDFAGGGLAQVLSHAAGPRSKVANGVVEAMLLPATMTYNAHVTGARAVRVAEALSGRRADQHSGRDIDPTNAIDAVRSVVHACGVPDRLSEIGLSPEQLQDIVDHTSDDWSLARVPRPASAADLLTLLSGEL